ncbi:phage Gp37/Gp68 family protein [Xanthomonas euroxanthea]
MDRADVEPHSRVHEDFCWLQALLCRSHGTAASGHGNAWLRKRVCLALDRRAPERPHEAQKATIYFVNSMSDLFHEKVPSEYIDRVMDVISQTPQHSYQILTKRAARMARYFKTRAVPSNAWLGVSVENRRHGVPRIDHLRKVDAKIRFLSVEPLLEDVGDLDLSNIHWVIVGGESGAKARPMKPEWADAVRIQCTEQDVAFFFKQWGGWGADGKRRAKAKNGRLLNGRTWDEMPMHAMM